MSVRCPFGAQVVAVWVVIDDLRIKAMQAPNRCSFGAQVSAADCLGVLVSHLPGRGSDAQDLRNDGHRSVCVR